MAEEHTDQLKLAVLRQLASEGFAEIERGEFEEIDAKDLEEFIERVDAQARHPNEK